MLYYVINLILILLALAAGTVQVWGAHLEDRPCKYVKYSYALSLYLSALFLFLFMREECNNVGLYASLGLLLFNILLGGSVRLISLRRTRQECPRL